MSNWLTGVGGNVGLGVGTWVGACRKHNTCVNILGFNHSRYASKHDWDSLLDIYLHALNRNATDSLMLWTNLPMWVLLWGLQRTGACNSQTTLWKHYIMCAYIYMHVYICIQVHMYTCIHFQTQANKLMHFNKALSLTTWGTLDCFSSKA